MILEVDIGNTRSKWRLVTEEGSEQRSGICNPDEIAVEAFRDLGGSQIPCRARVACVRALSIRQQFAHVLASHGIQAVFAESSAYCAGVTNGYSDPKRLGVDRWLAVIAAYAEVHGALCVVDCGSAITVDFVDEHGAHAGGYIAPGFRAMQQSLLAATDLVRFADAFNHGEIVPGRNTATAVQGGIQLAAVGVVEAALSRYRRHLPEVSLLLTGGDAELILPHLARPAFLRPTLVLDGLRLALP